MQRAEFDRLCDETWKRAQGIRAAKGKDYSGEDDVLASFKSNAATLRMDPMVVWSVLFMKHVDAVMTYTRDGHLASEGIQGRLDDILNYTLLLQAMVRENELDAPMADSFPSPPLHYPPGVRTAQIPARREAGQVTDLRGESLPGKTMH